MKGLLCYIAIGLMPFCTIGQDTTIVLESLMDGTHTLENGVITNIWGYQYYSDHGSEQLTLPSPTLTFHEGDSVELVMPNPADEGHTIHLHGLDVDQANDGVPATSYFVLTGDTGVYRFKVKDAGNYIYHCHVTSTLHVALGMYGMLIVKAANDSMRVWTGGPSFTKEHSYLISDLDESWNDDYTTTGGLNTYTPDHFLLNGKSGSQIYQDSSMLVEADQNDTVLFRLANVGFTIARFNFPAALGARIVTSDGRPLNAEEVSDTLRIYPGERYSVLFTPPSGFEGHVLVDYLSMYADEFLGQNSIPINTDLVYGSPDPLTIDGSIRLAPNPVSHVLHLTAGSEWNASSTQITIVEQASGRTVLQKLYRPGEGSSINVSRLPPGAYILELSNGSLRSTEGFIKL